jgi:hypothetical protein
VGESVVGASELGVTVLGVTVLGTRIDTTVGVNVTAFTSSPPIDATAPLSIFVTNVSLLDVFGSVNDTTTLPGLTVKSTICEAGTPACSAMSSLNTPSFAGES